MCLHLAHNSPSFKYCVGLCLELYINACILYGDLITYSIFNSLLTWYACWYCVWYRWVTPVKCTYINGYEQSPPVYMLGLCMVHGQLLLCMYTYRDINNLPLYIMLGLCLLHMGNSYYAHISHETTNLMIRIITSPTVHMLWLCLI